MNEKNNATSMHKSYFDKAKMAMASGYYFEALMLEYAAIEGRLEVICGLLGCPCNKELASEKRKSIGIEQRRKCLVALYKNHPACREMPEVCEREFWQQLKVWIDNRNRYVHGLYKNPSLYLARMQSRELLA